MVGSGGPSPPPRRVITSRCAVSNKPRFGDGLSLGFLVSARMVANTLSLGVVWRLFGRVLVLFRWSKSIVSTAEVLVLGKRVASSEACSAGTSEWISSMTCETMTQEIARLT